MVIDRSNVYWSNGSLPNALMKVPLGGGEPVTLVSAASAGFGTIGGLATDNVRVYWGTDDGDVKAVPVGGGDVTTLAAGQPATSGLAADSTSLYWATAVGPGDPGALERLSLTTGAIEMIVATGGISIALNSNIVAWTSLASESDEGWVYVTPK
jgi:hypothetical protein